MQTDGSTIYNSYTQVNTHIVKDITILYQFEVKIEADGFSASDVEIEVNGKIHKKTIITKIKDQFRVQENGKKEKWI